MRYFNAACLVVLLGSFTVAQMAEAQEQYAFDSPAWKLSGKQVSVESVAGRTAIKIISGKALLDNVVLEDGLVEFDMYLSGERAFAYFYFRGQSEQNFEEIYFRSHKSDAPDALQYSPVFQSRSAWQLYHGDSGTAAATLPAKQWIPVKLELKGPKMTVWVGGKTEPTMVINQLGGSHQKGYLAFRGFVPNTSTAPYAAYFSKLRITQAKTTGMLPAIEQTLPQGQLTQWRVSPAFDSESGPILDWPKTLPDSTQWGRPIMQSNGVFEFLRSRTIPKGSRHWSVVAQTTVKSELAQNCTIHLGFSDELSLFLNGRPLSYLDASYSFDNPRRQGLMYPEQGLIYLALQKGDNLIQAIVSDRFGGWGLSARLAGCDGVSEL
jgi:hypothetical protein